ncbi:MAG: LytR/AlgR family response regulator transcription factor [Flavobacteriaceae bacterium]
MKCIIIEDEIPAQKLVQRYISKLPELHLVASFQSALEANSFLKNKEIDLVFLDINLPDISGIQYIRTLTNPPGIIMTTAYPEHAAESFELDTIYDYLVKPFSFERFLKAINKVKRTNGYAKELDQEEEESSIFVNIDKTLYKVALRNIIYIKSDRNYITLATTEGKYTFIDSLKNWLVKLPKTDFIQVHKSYIVSCAKIDKLVGNVLFLNEERIPIGRTYKTELRKSLRL